MTDSLLNQSILDPSPLNSMCPSDILQSRRLLNMQVTSNNMLSTVMENDNPYIRDPYQHRCHEDYEGWKRTQESKGSSSFTSPITSLSYKDQVFMENFMRMKFEKWMEKYETARRDVEVQYQKRKQTPEKLIHAWKSTLDLFVDGLQSSEKTFRDLLFSIQQQVTLDVVVSPVKETIMEAMNLIYTSVLCKKDPVYFPEWATDSFRHLKESIFASIEVGFFNLAPSLSAYHPEVCSIKIKTIARYASMILTTQEENLHKEKSSRSSCSSSSSSSTSLSSDEATTSRSSLMCMAEDYVPAHLRYPFLDRISIEGGEPPESFHFSEISKTKRSVDLDKMEMSYSEAISSDSSSLKLGVQSDEERNRAAWKEWKQYFRPNRIRVFLDYREMDILEMIEGIIPGVQTFNIYPGDCHVVVGGTLIRMVEIKKKKDILSNYKQWKIEEPPFNNHELPPTCKEMWLVDMNSANTMTLENTIMTQSIASHLQQRYRWRVQFMDNFLTMMVRLYSDICSYVRVPIPLYRELQYRNSDVDFSPNELQPLYTKSSKGNSSHTKTMTRKSDNFSNAKYVFSLCLRTLIPGFPEAACEYFWAYFGTWTNMIKVLSSWSVEERISMLNGIYLIGDRMARIVSETFCPLKDLSAVNECRNRVMSQEETLRLEIIGQMPRKKTYREAKFFPDPTPSHISSCPSSSSPPFSSSFSSSSSSSFSSARDSDNDLLFPCSSSSSSSSPSPVPVSSSTKKKVSVKKKQKVSPHPSVVFNRYAIPASSDPHVFASSTDTDWKPKALSLRPKTSEGFMDSIEDYPLLSDVSPSVDIFPKNISFQRKSASSSAKLETLDDEEEEEENDPELEWFPQEEKEEPKETIRPKKEKQDQRQTRDAKRRKPSPTVKPPVSKSSTSSSSSPSNTLLFQSQYTALLKKMQKMSDD